LQNPQVVLQISAARIRPRLTGREASRSPEFATFSVDFANRGRRPEIFVFTFFNLKIMNIAKMLVDTLVNAGVSQVHGLVGDSANAVAHEIKKNAGSPSAFWRRVNLLKVTIVVCFLMNVFVRCGDETLSGTG
jgi:hypothetical protein